MSDPLQEFRRNFLERIKKHFKIREAAPPGCKSTVRMTSFSQRLEGRQPRLGTGANGFFNRVRTFSRPGHATADPSSGRTPAKANVRDIIEAAALLGRSSSPEKLSTDSGNSVDSRGASSGTEGTVDRPPVESSPPARASSGKIAIVVVPDFTPGRPASPSSTTAATPSNGRKRKQCSRDGCSKRPSFASSGESPARCASHKLEHDVNVKHRQCVMPSCTLRSRFGRPGSKPSHCILHRQPDEIDPFRPPCIFPGCMVTPTFSSQGRRPERCASHKMDGDMNTNRQRCGEPQCRERPCFFNSVTGVKHCRSHFAEGDTGGLRGMCQSRDLDGMVPCRKYATFAAEKGRPLRCKDHRLPGDFDVLNRMCEADGCRKRPSFGDTGGVAKRCKSHASDVDVNVTGKRCSVPGCDTIVGMRRVTCKAHRG